MSNTPPIKLYNHSGQNDIMNKLENEKNIVKKLFEQLLGFDDNLSSSNNKNQINNLFNGSGSNNKNNYGGDDEDNEKNRFIIKNYSKIYEIVILLKDEEISSFIKIKILDQLIQILNYSSNNTINLIIQSSPTTTKCINNTTTSTTTTTSSFTSNPPLNNSTSQKRKSKTLYTNKSLVILDELIQMLPTIDNESISLKTLELIEILGTEHITVKQLRKLLKLFDKNYLLTNFKPNHYFLQNGLPNLLKSLDVMTFRKGPSSIFYMNGINSGLIVDPIGKLSNSGYTISTWINIESFKHYDNELNRIYEPRLFSFLNDGSNGSDNSSDENEGIEFYFESSHKLIFKINSKIKATVILDGSGFPTNKWCHLVITQSPKKWGLYPGSTTTCIYLNGKLIHTQQLKYPSTSKNLNICSIGTVPCNSKQQQDSSNSNNNNTSSSNQQSECCLKCQMGSFSMLNIYFDHNDVLEIFKKGSNYLIKKTNKSLLFTFSPRSYYGGICHGQSGVRELNNLINAFSIGDLKLFSTFSIKDSIYLIGGPQIIFPLFQTIHDQFKLSNGTDEFSNVNQQSPNLTSSSSSSISNLSDHLQSTNINTEVEVVSSTSKISLTSSESMDNIIVFNGSQDDINQLSKMIVYPRISGILRFLTHLLVNDKYNQKDIIQFNGMSILGHLMSMVFSNSDCNPLHPYHWKSLEREEFDLIFDSLDQLTDNIMLLEKNAILKLNIYREIIFNFNIWINIKKEYQIQLFNLIIFKVSQDPQYFREHIKVRYILDCIKYYYHDHTQKTSTSTQPSNNHLSLEDITEITSYLFDIIKIIIKPALYHEKEVGEISEIIKFIQDSECNSIVIKESLMILLFNLFLPVNNNGGSNDNDHHSHEFNGYDTIKGFLNSFESSGDIKSILGLLKHDNENVQVLVIKIIGKYLSGTGGDDHHGSGNSNSKSSSGSGSGSGSSGSTTISSKPNKNSLSDALFFITDSLMEFEFTDLMYRSLSEIVVDQITPNIIDTPNSPLLELLGSETSMNDTIINSSGNGSNEKNSKHHSHYQHGHGKRNLNISALESICRLAIRAQYPLQQKILNEILLCIKHLPKMRQGILESENWQHWLLSLWPSPRSNTSSPPWSPPISPLIGSTKHLTPLQQQQQSSQYIQAQNVTQSQLSHLATKEQLSIRAFQSGIKEILTGIIKVLLFDCINKKDGWKFIEETEAWIFSILPNGVPLERRIFYECLMNLERGLKISTDSNLSGILLKNYVNLVSIIEDFVFSHTMNILAHRNTQSQWEDFGVVAKLLDIFDISQSIQTIRIQTNVIKPTSSHSLNLFSSSNGTGMSHSQPQGSMQLSPYIMTLANNSGTIELPSIDVTSGSAKAKSSIHTIYRLCLCIFQEAESCFYGERESYHQSKHDHQSENADDEERNFAIRVWGLPMISEDMDQVISKNSIRIQTILASEKDQKEQVKHVMWIVCSLITIIRRHKENYTDKIVINTQSIIIQLLKSLLKTYGDLIDNFINPTNLLSPITDSINKVVSGGNSSSVNLSNSSFQVFSISSLNEKPDHFHPEFLKYFRETLLGKITLLDKLHEIKDHYENAHLSSAFTMTRRNKVLEAINVNHQKQLTLISYKVNKLLTKSISTCQKYEFKEIQRKSDFKDYQKQYTSYLLKLWDTKFKYLTLESTPWSLMDPTNNQNHNPEKIIWKLYDINNSNRVNYLLKKDYNGTDHPFASLSNQKQLRNSINISKLQQSQLQQQSSPKVSNSEELKNNPILRKIAKLSSSQQLKESMEDIESQSDGLVGFEISSFENHDSNIVLDDVHENDWCLVDEQQNILKKTTTLSNNSQSSSPSSSNTSSTTTITTTINEPSTTITKSIFNLNDQLNQLNPKPITSSKKSNLEFSAQGEIIKPMLVIRVKLSIFTDKLIFSPNSIQEDTCIPDKHLQDREYEIKKIIGVQNRRYLLLPTALEFFFTDRKSILVNFPKGSIVAQIMKLIGNLYGSNDIIFKINTNNLNLFESNHGSNNNVVTPQQSVIKYLNPTARWKKREISNFEYLMALNTIAGRTFNDLNQYPVFPWIISEYNSDELSLSSGDVYRDLTKPIGALNSTRLDLFMERWTQCPVEIPAFMYGTHYSSSGSVMFFLMRCEPFTSHFIKLQSGHFDHADRMFDSIQDCWRNCLNSSSDVKELTPEFFYQPEFLINRNKVEFGVKQNGKSLDNVQLPPWAQGSVHKFIMINRMALESEYVSMNLHHWIDLIFGYKQRGKESIKANNVFYHLTYEGSVDIGTMNDPILREATRVQINNFGVTPSQLFPVNPHPQRDPLPSNIVKYGSKLDQFKKLKPLHLISLPFSPLVIFCYNSLKDNSSGGALGGLSGITNTSGNSIVSGLVNGGTSFLSGVGGGGSSSGNGGSGNFSQLGDRVLIIGESLNNDLQYYRYLDSNNFVGTTTSGSGGNSTSSAANISQMCITPLPISSQPLTLSPGLKLLIGKPYCQIPGNSKVLLTSGKCDYTLHLVYGDSKLITGSISHKSPITCIAYDEYQCGRLGVGGILVEQKVIVTGSDDSTAIIWEYESGGDGSSNTSGGSSGNQQHSIKPIQILRGHNFGITCVSLNKANDICLTASKDGKVNIHSIRKGTFFKSIQHPNKLSIHSMILDIDSLNFFIYSNDKVVVDSGSSNGGSEIGSDIGSSNGSSGIVDEKNNVLYRYSINGDLINSVLNDVQPTIVKMLITKSQNGIRYLLTAGGYQIVIREMLNLEIVHVFDIRDLSGFTNSNKIVDISLWGGDESFSKLSNSISGSDSNNNNNSVNSTLTLLVPLESCQLLIYSFENGNLKSLSD